MSDKGRLSGYNWHFEYHTTDRKKEKAADCIYLTTDRICQNKKSIQYLGKCFIASDCPLRLRQAQANEIERRKTLLSAQQKKEPKIISIQCTLPKRCYVFSKTFGKGKYIEYNEESMIIAVKFGEKIIHFQYPQAILDKHLILPKFAFKQVLFDISKAKKG